MSSDCTDLDKYFGIKIFYSTNVLQATEDGVIVAEADGSDAQLWQLVPSARLGTFNILSKSSGYVLTSKLSLLFCTGFV